MSSGLRNGWSVARYLAPAGIVFSLLLHCGDSPEAPVLSAPVPDASQELSLDMSEATPKQKKALANPLHDAHLEDEEEPSKCRDCHRIEGHEPVKPASRCLDCHEELADGVHSEVETATARACLTCHEFMAPEIDPWTCHGCHTDVADAPEPKHDLPGAPMVSVHSEEACETCHLPHGEDRILLASCLECHDEQTSTHHETELSDPAQCAECHESHDPAERARSECASCHRGDVTATTALFDGHDGCLSCHAPHEIPEIVACSSCHEGQETSGMHTAPAHADCTSCHDPHRVSNSPEASCIRCHDEADVDHPEDSKHGTCVGCHPSHPIEGRHLSPRKCTSCHREASSETEFHLGERCTTCHEPHDFVLEGPEKRVCDDCHLEGASQTVRGESRTERILVEPIADHSLCSDCHVEANHDPSRKTEPCGTCHSEQIETMTAGHETCGECHRPHEATIETTCKDCHEQKWTSRHTTDGRDCDSCHRSHGPDGPAEPKACDTCHDESLPLLHQHEGHSDCADCHDFHDRVADRARSACLSACHQDLTDHEPEAKSCVGCHPFETGTGEWTRVKEALPR